MTKISENLFFQIKGNLKLVQMDTDLYDGNRIPSQSWRIWNQLLNTEVVL